MTDTRIRSIAAALLAGLLLLGGCAQNFTPAGQGPSLQELEKDQERRQREAEALYWQGVAAMAGGKMLEAEGLFESAVALNPYHGAAHNDLGVIYFQRGRLHDAAVEFDAASKNLLNHHEPLFNLAMVWESAGRFKEAAEAYDAALKLAPGETAIMENLARVYLKLDINPRETTHLLQEALLRETRPDWQDWIRMQLLKLKSGAHPVATITTQPDKPT